MRTFNVNLNGKSFTETSSCASDTRGQRFHSGYASEARRQRFLVLIKRCRLTNA